MMIIIIIITITTMTALTGCHVPATEWCQHYPLSAMLLIFSFQFSLLFFYVGSWKCGKYVSYTWRTAQEKDFELILTIKMKTRHPVEGYFGIEFQAICNQHGVIVALSCKVWNFCEQFLRFLKKIPYSKISKFCSERFHCLTDRHCCVEMSWNLSDGKSAKSCVIYRPKITKFWLRLKLTVLRGLCLKSARPAPNRVLTVLQISSKSFHFWWSYSRLHEHCFCSIE